MHGHDVPAPARDLANRRGAGGGRDAGSPARVGTSSAAACSRAPASSPLRLPAYCCGRWSETATYCVLPTNLLTRLVSSYGNKIVEFFSVAISAMVWSVLRWRAPGVFDKVSAASASFTEACSSPSA